MTHVTLAIVDEPLLARFTDVAVHDAAAPEVTPPLTDGDAWTPERIAWFEEYHRRCRLGLHGEGHEAAWAIMADDRPAGAVRLQRTKQDGVLETGIWLARSARGQGLSRLAIEALLDEARATGAHALRADTAETNLPAQALMRGMGFELAAPAGGRVHGVLPLGKS